jgi:hypothetical protein
MTGYVEILVDQGTDFNNIIYLTDDTTNDVINAAGYTAQSQIRRSYYSANITANMTCTFSNTANGELTLTMNAATTANIRAGRYVFDVKVTNASNTVSRILEGIINVTPSVTR